MSSPPSPPARPQYAEDDKARARKLFEHARKAAETKNYDYAIELYLNGLEVWPEAVEEGLKGLRVAGTARRMAGRKAPGFLATRKHPTNGRDARRNLLNALRLFGLDPTNAVHMEAVLVNAARAGCTATGAWIAPILWDALVKDKKRSSARYEACYRALDALGEQLQLREDWAATADVFRIAQLVAELWREHHPVLAEASKALSDASSKLTIVRGRFGTTEDFRSSLKDAAAQRDLHDRGRIAQDEARLRELIAQARVAYEADAETPAKLFAYVDLLLRIESADTENQAVALLTAAYEKNSNYAFKARADDVQMRQQRRTLREALERARGAPGDVAVQARAAEATRRQIELEIGVFRDRVARYPTDLRMRFELGRRLFEARQFDEAIPLLQQAQSEPRRRDEARLFVGRAFHEKRFDAQAIDVLQAALRDHENPEDEVGKELLYWLARACEAAGRRPEALDAYGKLIQLDYNHRDGRQRLEALHAAGR